jgi:hypothetical protein
MSLLIFSESNDPPTDFWRYCDKLLGNDQVIECSVSDIEYNFTTKRKGNGFFVNILGKVYIVTCSHIISQNNAKTISYYNVGEKWIFSDLRVLKLVEEFDIGVLEITQCQENGISAFDGNSKMDLSDFTNVMIVKSYTEKEGNFEEIEIKAIFCGIENLKSITECIAGYEIPYINLYIDGSQYELQGQSGSIVCNAMGKPIGMITSLDLETGIVHAIPFNILMEFVKVIVTNRFNAPSVLIFNSDLVKDQNEDGTINFYGHLITNDFDIKYNVQGRKKPFKFKKDDIITSINGNKINDNGRILCDMLGFEFGIKSYAMLHLIFHKFVSINFIRDGVIQSITIEGVNPEVYLSYNLHKHTTFLCHDGCIFVELSECIMKYFKSKNISFAEKMLATINTQSKQKKYIIIINLNNESGSDIATQSRSLKILKKVGHHEIPNLHELKNILNKKISNKTVTYSYF